MTATGLKDFLPADLNVIYDNGSIILNDNNLNYTNYEVSLVSMNGEIVIKGNMTGNTFSLRVNNLAKGTYVLVMQKDSDRFTANLSVK